MMEAAARRRTGTARGAILALVVLGLLFTSVYPLRRYIAVRHEITALRQEERALDDNIAQIEEQKQLLRTDEEMERIAREELGMVRPGEIAVVIPSARASTEPLPTLTEPGQVDETNASLFDRWWGALSRAWRIVR